MAKKLPSPADILAAAKAAPPPKPVSPPKPVRKVHELRVQEAGDKAIRQALITFWQTVIDVAHAQQSADWDIIVCLLSDSGWIRAWAAKCLLPFRFPQHYADLNKSIEHFHFPGDGGEVRLYVAEHERQLYEIDERCEEDDDLLGRELQQLADRKLQLLRKAAGDRRIKSQLAALPIHGVFACFESETLHEVNLIHVAGQPLPRPPVPVTALEVFSRLYHQTHRGIGKNMGLKFEKEELVAISLTGGDTSDATLALLAEVDNLQTLCRNVRQIDLSDSNVTKQGLARLRRLLPMVEVLR